MKLKITSFMFSAMLLLGLGSTSLMADNSKASKCGSDKKEMVEKCGTAKCGGDKKEAPKSPAKCG